MNSLPITRSLLALAFASFAAIAAADEITLKDGTKYDGPIVAEDDASITIKISRGQGITKNQRISKSDILRHEKTTPDKLRAEELRKLVPTPDGMSDAEYQRILTEDIVPFLNRYPSSPYKAEIEKIRALYEDEKLKAKNGEKKVEGEWVSAEVQSWDGYNFNARLKRVELDKLVKEGRLQDAYAIFSSLEREKPASVEYVKALQSITSALPGYAKQIEQAAKEFPIRKQEREEYVKSLNPESRRAFEANVKAAAEKLKLEIDAARGGTGRAAGHGILPFDPYDDKSIKAAQDSVQKEIQRLQKIDVDTLKRGTESFRKGLKDMFDKNYDLAQRNFSAAAAIPSIGSDPSGFVKQQLELAKKAAVESTRATREAGGSTPGIASAAAAQPRAAGSSPAREPSKTAAGAPVRSSTASNAPAAGDEEEFEEEPESSMPMYLMIGAGVVLVAGLIAKALSGKKAGA